jgi:hypothetical protein
MEAFRDTGVISDALEKAFFRYIDMISIDESSAETPHKDTHRTIQLACNSKPIWWSTNNRRQQSLELVENFAYSHDPKIFKHAWEKFKGIVHQRLPTAPYLVRGHVDAAKLTLRKVYRVFPYNTPDVTAIETAMKSRKSTLAMLEGATPAWSNTDLVKKNLALAVFKNKEYVVVPTRPDAVMLVGLDSAIGGPAPPPRDFRVFQVLDTTPNQKTMSFRAASAGAFLCPMVVQPMDVSGEMSMVGNVPPAILNVFYTGEPECIDGGNVMCLGLSKCPRGCLLTYCSFGIVDVKLEVHMNTHEYTLSS